MAFSKAHIFTKGDYHNSIYCKALGHPARIAILKYLWEQKKCIPSDLSKFIPLSGASISHHFRILRNAHILDFEEQHPYIIYWISNELTKFQRATLERLIHDASSSTPIET